MHKLARVLVVQGVLASFGVGHGQAQPRVLFRGGASVSTIGGEGATDVGFRTGVRVGLSALFEISNRVGVEVGSAYVEKGARRVADGVDATFKLDYAEFPVLLRLALPTGGSVSPHLLLGPAVALEVGCNSAGDDRALPCNTRGSEVRVIDFGGMAGAGASMSTSGPLWFSIDVLYGLGLTSIDASPSPDDVRNRAWSILVGVGFPISR